MIAAVLDTSILWPALQRNFLLSLAHEGAFIALWSGVILDELEYEVQQKWVFSDQWTKQDAMKYAHKLRTEMEKTFPNALVTGWEDLEGSFGLPDPNDEHVLGVAILARAGVIVTSNLKDFPKEKLPGALVALSPQVFVKYLVDLAPDSVLSGLEQMSARSGRVGPVQTPAEIAQELTSRYGMTTVERVLPK